MLDVHPPHQSVHSWRDFFIHIATICVGLLIALGLEQSVEAIHRASERRELREALTHESEQILKDCEDVGRMSDADTVWVTAAQRQLSDASASHHPAGALPRVPNMQANAPSDPIFRAATAGNQLELLSRGEIEAYSEVDQILIKFAALSREASEAADDFADFEHSQSFGKPTGTPPLQEAAPQDLKRAYELLSREERAIRGKARRARGIQGAEVAILGGERDLQKIDAVEYQYEDGPSHAAREKK